jgi:hypothetical protein
MRENSAFYRQDNDFSDLSRDTGARFIKDLDECVKNKTIRFTDDAFVLFCGCKAAGDTSPDMWSLAHWFTVTIGGTTVGAIGGSDQFKAPSPRVERALWYWAIFTTQEPKGRELSPQEIHSTDKHVLDPIHVIHR